jgi:hypothetical protein
MSTNVHATSPTLIPQGTPVPSKVTAPAQLRSSEIRSLLPFSQALANDLDALSKHVNKLHSVLATNAPSISQLLLTDQQGQVVAAFGDFIYDGIWFTNYLNEIHVGDPLLTNDPQKALFNANTDGSVTIGQNGWLDVLDPFGGSAAWIGTQNDSNFITGAVNNGAGLIRLTVPGHHLVTGNSVRVQNVGGIGTPPPPNGTFHNNATGNWTVTVIDATTIDLQGSVFAGSYTGGGIVDRVLQVSSIADNGSGLVRVVTAAGHDYETGDETSIQNVTPAANGQWIITVIDGFTFDLQGSVFSGSYSGGGTSLRYFAGMLAQTVAIGPSFAGYNIRQFADGSLRIRNASITLSNGGNNIILDPTGPSIKILPAAGGSIVLDSTGITVTSPGGNHITISATSGNISSSGLINAGGATEDITPAVGGPTLHFVNGVYTGHT